MSKAINRISHLGNLNHLSHLNKRFFIHELKVVHHRWILVSDKPILAVQFFLWNTDVIKDIDLCLANL